MTRLAGILRKIGAAAAKLVWAGIPGGELPAPARTEPPPTAPLVIIRPTGLLLVVEGREVEKPLTAIQLLEHGARAQRAAIARLYWDAET